MHRMLLGMETEYAISAQPPRSDLLMSLMRVAGERLTCLPGHRQGDLYLGNGARFYIDCGGHPEYATPECETPSDVVRYALAGDRILDGLAGALRAEDPRAIQVFKSNVDYSGARTTWGCHESYLYRSAPATMPDEIIPHLVSRIIFTGAGGFNALSTKREFTISPRVWHLEYVTSNESTGHRAIFHTKNEPLARRGTHRLHLICGESLSSHLATWLKMGTTAIVVAMTDCGIRPGRAVHLGHPLDAMRTFAADPDLKARVKLADGGSIDALTIQRHYLIQAEECVDRGILPAWAGEVCREWRRVLDALAYDPLSLAHTLDWVIKRKLYVDRAAQLGVQWSCFPGWPRRLPHPSGPPKSNAASGSGPSVDPPPPRRRREVPVIAPLPIGATGPRVPPPRRPVRENLSRLSRFKLDFLELDLRFAELGERGIFVALDRAGVLDHGAPGVDRLDLAIEEPPSSGRAHVRGQAIRERVGKSRNCRADWSGLVDLEHRESLSLLDPFASEASWRSDETPDDEAFIRAMSMLDF